MINTDSYSENHSQVSMGRLHLSLIFRYISGIMMFINLGLRQCVLDTQGVCHKATEFNPVVLQSQFESRGNAT